MSDRVVKVTLSAQVQQYIAGMEKARKATAETGTEAAKLGQKKQDFELLGRAGLAMGAALGVGLTIAVSKAADFNQAMSFVDAATHETADNMALLRDAALEAGASTVFSATESANAIEQLGKAGLSTKDILSGALAGSLSLAAAGGLGVAEAAGDMSTALKQFGLEGKDSAHVADLLAAGSGKAMGDVSDMAQALNQAGLVANSTGLSIEETTGTLAAFADAGLLGSDAGTSLKTMLQRLVPQSAEAQAEMDRLNLSAYDSQGQFIGVTKYAGLLQDRLSDLTPQQRAASEAIMFGSDAVRGATVLYEEGADGIQKYIDQTDDAGYAADTARRRLDNLKGDVEQLGGAFDTALIQTGSQANDALRFLTQSATDAVDAFNRMPEPMQAAVLGIGGVAAAGTLAFGAFFSLIPKVAEFKDAIADMSPGVRLASRLMGGLAAGAGIAAAFATAGTIIQEFINSTQHLSQSDAQISNTVNTVGDLSEMLQKLSAYQAGGGTVNAIKDITDLGDAIDKASAGRDTRGWEFWADITAGFTLQGADVGVNRLRDSFDALGQELATQVSAGDLDAVSAKLKALKDEGKLTDAQLYDMIKLSQPLMDALTLVATKSGDTADQQSILKAALEGTGDSTEIVTDGLAHVTNTVGLTADQVDGLIDSIRNYGAATSELISANSDLYQSVDDAKAAWGAEGFAATLDLTTQAGRDNTDMLLGIADAASNAAAETYENTHSQDDLIAKLGEGRQALYDQARQFFDTDEAAWNYVDSLMQTPENITTQVNLNGVAEAQAQIDAFVAQYQGKTITMQMFLESSGGDKGLAASAARYTAQAQDYYETHASGGTVGGSGNSKSDSVYTRLSRGEEVIQEPYASMFRPELKQMNRGLVPANLGSGSGSSTAFQFDVHPSRGMDEVAFAKQLYAEAQFRERVSG